MWWDLCAELAQWKSAIASNLNNDKSLIHSKCTIASDRQCRSSLLNKYIINQLVEEYIAEGK
jgi:hypothetical protein